MRQLGLVFAYSFMERLRSKAFKNTTVIMILILSLLILLPRFLSSSEESVDGEIAVLNTTAIDVKAEGFKTLVSPSYDWTMIGEAELDAARKRLAEEEELLGIVRIDEPAGQPVVTLIVNKMDDAPYAAELNNFVQNQYTMSEMGKLTLKPEQLDRLTAAVQLEVSELQAGAKSVTTTYLPIYLITFMLYLLIYLFGGNVAVSVSVEKGSRVKEILITKVKPEQLLFGKVFGVGLAGLLQFVIILGAGYLLLMSTGSGATLELFGMQVDFSILDGKTVALLVLFFVLGYFFYAALFAAAGSLVSRSEEINQVTLPVSLMMMAGLMVAITTMMNPEGTLAIVGSYIPFVTPFVMFARIGMADPSWMDILVPTGILFISTIGACLLSAKIYQVGVLLYGQKPSPKLVYKAMRSL
ncbi:ABC transporter permease [Paenibacillus xanthanilyticus]|uniref:ABC transporter permease n=1 Tax=Paenibacillus xanthanilyticus TaxID=1783531 RepID=A0ABV8JZR4_9BACL